MTTKPRPKPVLNKLKMVLASKTFETYYAFTWLALLVVGVITHLFEEYPVLMAWYFGGMLAINAVIVFWATPEGEGKR